MNTKNPNSFRNTIPVCVFSGKDNPANREAALGLYRSQLEKLSSSEWESGSGCKFKIKILLCGDDEFLTTLYGLSGASGLHPRHNVRPGANLPIIAKPMKDDEQSLHQ